MNYTGTIIEESLKDRAFISELSVVKTEVEPTTTDHRTPWLSQWTLDSVEIDESKIDELAEKISQALETEHPWYADFKNEKFHYVVFAGKVFKIDRAQKEQYQAAVDYGVSLGIPGYQLDFSSDIKAWERAQEKNQKDNESPASPVAENKKLYRSRTDRVLFGVCGGLAQYVGLDSTIIRLLFILFFLANGLGLIAYIILAIVVPLEAGENIPVDHGEKIKEFAEEVGEKVKNLAEEVKRQPQLKTDIKKIFGILVILAGVGLLINQLFPAYFSWLNWVIIWPILIIVLGVYLIYRK